MHENAYINFRIMITFGRKKKEGIGAWLIIFLFIKQISKGNMAKYYYQFKFGWDF